MKILSLAAVIVLSLLSTSASAGNSDSSRDLYLWMTSLEGDWMLAPADQQEGKATHHKLVAPLVGTDTTAIRFRTIGKGSTVQETLLPGTKKEMVTMYHCYDSVCSQVKATHYCVKQNQPEMFADPSSHGDSVVYNCDMNTALCQSRENHIHNISHTLSDGGNRLKTVYSSYADGKAVKQSTYHFVKK